MDELQVGDEVEVVVECNIKGKRGKIVEITHIFIVEIEGKKETFAYSESIRKITEEELQVGDEVEILYYSDKSKRGKIVKIVMSSFSTPPYPVYTVDVDGTTHRYGRRDSLRKITDTCTCDRIFLFNNGCKCGHWERQKNGNSKSKHPSCR